MRRALAALLVTAFLAGPAAATTQLSVGARLGYGAVRGEVLKGVGTSELIVNEIPFQVEAAFKPLPSLSLGAYYVYGISPLKSGSGIDSANDTRLGVAAEFSPLAAARLGPWIGAGAGWGWLSAKGAGQAMVIHGWDLMVDGGLDYRISEKSAVGLCATYAIGQYTSGKITIPSTRWASGSIGSGQVATHGLFTVGVRGVLSI